MTLPRWLDPWLPPLALMAVIFVVSHQPDVSSGLGLLDLIGRKVLHMAEYALLCLLWWRALRTVMPAARAIPVALAISVVYAASDEYHQTFVEGRHGSPLDVAIDAVGAAAAALALRRRPSAAGAPRGPRGAGEGRDGGRRVHRSAAGGRPVPEHPSEGKAMAEERKWREEQEDPATPEQEDPATPEQAAALNVPKREADRADEDPAEDEEVHDNPLASTEQHSDAPGPFGTS